MSTHWPARAIAAVAVLTLAALTTVVFILWLDDDDSETDETGTPRPSVSPPVVLSATPGIRLTPGATLRPSTPPPLGEPILPPGGPSAATELVAESVCSQVQLRTPFANLSWQPATNGGAEQRVVVSVARDGLERGIYTVGAALSTDAQSLIWNGTQPGINHFWWVLTLHAGGWAPSEMSEFLGATCEADVSE